MKSSKKKPTKIVSFLLSVLILFSMFPIAVFAATPVAPEVYEWPIVDGKAELFIGQNLSNLKLVGGSAAVDGHFDWSTPDSSSINVGVVTPTIYFYPDDTVNYKKVRGKGSVTYIKSTEAKVNGTLSVKPLQAGQKLSEAEFVKSDDFAMISYDTSYNTAILWENPDKVMEQSGTFSEKVTVYAANKKGIALAEDVINPVELTISVTVEGSASDLVELKNIPAASNIKVGKTLADSVLTGGLVTKGGEPLPGTFTWKDATIAPAIGTSEYTVVFNPTDTAACEPIEMQVSVTTEKLTQADVELTWPEVKGHYKANAVVKDCVTLTGGEANIEGEFRVTEESKYMRIPASITDSMEIELIFIPKDTVNYEKQRKTVTVSFEPAEPNCVIGYRVSGDKRSYEINAFLRNDENWDIKTGKFYLVLDGEKIELDEAFSSLDYDYNTLGAGNHTIQAVYEPGENDFYVKGESETIEFSVDGFYNVNVTDFAGTTSQDYLPGKTVTVTAQPHEKSYYDFTGWTADGVELTDEEKAQQSITFEMPENEVNLTANYKFNFCNFVKYVFEQIGIKLMALVQQGIAWLKDAIQNIPRP